MLIVYVSVTESHEDNIILIDIVFINLILPVEQINQGIFFLTKQFDIQIKTTASMATLPLLSLLDVLPAGHLKKIFADCKKILVSSNLSN